MENLAIDFKSLFESTPGLYLILLPDFTIVAGSDTYLQATMTKREHIIGKNLFEVFPDNPDDLSADGVFNLKASLSFVLKNKIHHAMPLQRYDIKRTDGTFEERYWNPLNKPVLNSNNQIVYLIHSVEDVTVFTQLQHMKDELADANKKLEYESVEKEKRADELLVANEELAFQNIEKEKRADELIVANEELAFQNIEKEKRADELTIAYKAISDYKRALDESSILAITDHKGMIKHVNENFCAISQYSSAELIGQDHRIVNSGYHSKQFIKNLWSTISKGKVWKGELKNKAKDGTIYWVDTTIVPFLNDEGKPYQYVAIRSDITERKIAEEKLKKEEILFRSLIENNNDMISMIGSKGNTIYISPSVVKQFGYTYQECLALNFSQIIHADDLPVAQQFMTEVIQSPSITLQCPIIRNMRKDGTFFWVEGSLTNLLKTEGINAIVSNFRDITERIKKEEELTEQEKMYRYLFQHNPMPMWIIDAETFEFLSVNEAAIMHYGYSREEFHLMTALDIRPKEDTERFINLNRKSPSNGPQMSDNWHHIKKDGSIIHVEISVDDIVYENKKARLILSHDVTDKVLAQEEIKLLNEVLEQKVIERTIQFETVNEELEAFTYSVSHDLRTPLRAINGYSTMLEEDYNIHLDDEGKRLLKHIKQNASNMGVLIDDLLSFSRLGRQEIKKSKIDMNELVNAVVNQLNQSNKNNAEINIGNLSPLMGDYALICQVMINIISNAIKYSANKKQPTIAINSEKRNGIVVFSVKDNGAGFEMQYANKLFGVFQRMHSNEDFEGTGVGLAIVQRIINKHNGKVWAEAKLDEGATFFFTLPD